MSDSKDTLIIGVDGGGTGCRVAVGTERDGVLIEQSGGRANVSTDLVLAIANIKEAVEAATLQAGLDPKVLDRAIAHLGLAGVMTQTDADKVARALPYANCAVTDDRLTAVTGALDGADGFLVSTGTGTIIATCQAQKLRYVGGWGFHVSDQASAAWLGRLALDRTLQCHDKVLGHTDMTRKLLAHFNSDPNAIVTFSMSASPSDYGSFSPLVVDAATKGDALGLELMRDGADYITRGLTALGFKEGDALCLTGGVGPHYAPFLGQDLTGRIVQTKRTAVEGAFHMALLAARKMNRVGT